jgi:hypothetical protein
MQNIREHLHLIWADKIVLGIALVMAALAGVLWLLVALAAGLAGANHVIASFGTTVFQEAVLGFVAVWLALRAIDFAAGGSTYKLFAAQSPSTDASVLPAGKLILH